MQSGESFLVFVRDAVKSFSDRVFVPDNPDFPGIVAFIRGTAVPDRVALPRGYHNKPNQVKVQDKFVLRQWRDIEEMLVEKGAAA
jgi:hypothetical protein